MMIFQFIILQIIVFGAVIYALKRILYGDTESAINRLGQVYEDLLKKQKDLTDKIEAGEKEYRAKQEEATTLADKFKTQAMDEVRKKEDEIVKAARKDAEEIIGKAQAAKDDLAKEIENKLSHRMIDFASAILRGAFSENLLVVIHEEMLKNFLARSKDLDLSSASDSAQELIVRTPIPLKPEQSEKLTLLLVTKLNRKVTYVEVPDKELIAGVILQFGTLLLDGCLASAIKEAGDKCKEKFHTG